MFFKKIIEVSVAKFCIAKLNIILLFEIQRSWTGGMVWIRVPHVSTNFRQWIYPVGI